MEPPGVWDLTAALSNLGDRLRERGALGEARAPYMEALPLRAGDPSHRRHRRLCRQECRDGEARLRDEADEEDEA